MATFGLLPLSVTNLPVFSDMRGHATETYWKRPAHVWENLSCPDDLCVKVLFKPRTPSWSLEGASDLIVVALIVGSFL